MNLPNKMKIIDVNDSSETIEKQLSALPLDDNYVVVYRSRGEMPFNELLSFSESLGMPLSYEGKNYYSFDKVHLECELHYDGISSDGVRAMPDWLVFYMENTPKEEGGEFRLLNCVSVLNDLDEETINVLETSPLEIYGLKHWADPEPEPFKLSFSIKNIVTENGVNVLRMHIPTDDMEMVSIEPEFVHCKIDDFRMRFRGLSGPESAEIFRKIHKTAFSDKHLLEISLEEGDAVFVKNRFVFHGRNSCVAPTTRLMQRIQLVE